MNEIQQEIIALIKEGAAATDPRVAELRERMLDGKTVPNPAQAVCAKGTAQDTAQVVTTDITIAVADTSVNSVSHGEPMTKKMGDIAKMASRKDRELRSLSSIFSIRGTYTENGVEYAVDKGGADIQFIQPWPRVDHIALATSYSIDSDYKTLNPRRWDISKKGTCATVDYYDAVTPAGMLRLVDYKQLDALCAENTLNTATKIICKIDSKPIILFDWYESYADTGSALYRGMLDASFPDVHEAWLELGGHHIIAAKQKGERTVSELTNNIIKMCRTV